MQHALTRLTATERHQLEGENFPVALRVLPSRTRARLLSLYRYARYVDDLGDDYAVSVSETRSDGDPAGTRHSRRRALLHVAAELRDLYAGRPVRLDPVRGLEPLVRECRVPIGVFLGLVQANLHDQVVNRYQTFDDLLLYCSLSACPVGQAVLHIFDQATPDRIELSNQVCVGLQLIEHWQDISEDLERGRIYVPVEDLARFGVAESDLKAMPASSAVRALIGFETERALDWIDSGAALLPMLRGWARLAVSAYVAGGRAAAAELRRRDFDPLGGVPKPRGGQIARAWLLGPRRSRASVGGGS